MCPLSTWQPLVQGFCWAHGSPTSKAMSAPPAKSRSFSISVEICPLAAHGAQCSLDALGITRDDGEVGFSRLVGLRAALFPIPQSSKRDSESCGNRDRGDASRLRPSHTTGRAGPHPAVRWVELSVHSQAWNPKRVEVSIRQRDAERGRVRQPPGAEGATRRLSGQVWTHTPLA
jgi:hypothetical protein